MKLRHVISGILLLVQITLLSGCVELLGQRICTRYDAALDRLEVLLFYDGIHESEGGYGNGQEDIPEFVANGDVMFFDWPWHYHRSVIEEKTADPESPPAVRELGQSILENVQTHVIGHYYDMDGHIGAAQLVVFNRASEIVSKINAVFNESILSDLSKTEDWPTELWQQMFDTAQRGHQWIALEGQALVVDCPMGQRQWACAMATSLRELLTAAGDDPAARQALVNMAAMISFYEPRQDRVLLRVGQPDQANVYRLVMRGEVEYNETLEDVVVASVPVDLEEQIAAVVLDGAAAEPAVTAVIAFGPPEVQVNALLTAAAGNDPDRASKAIAAMANFAERWNEQYVVPPAPQPMEDTAAYLDTWRQWYCEASTFPAGPIETKPPASTTQPAPE